MLHSVKFAKRKLLKSHSYVDVDIAIYICSSRALSVKLEKTVDVSICHKKVVFPVWRLMTHSNVMSLQKFWIQNVLLGNPLSIWTKSVKAVKCHWTPDFFRNFTKTQYTVVQNQTFDGLIDFFASNCSNRQRHVLEFQKRRDATI